MIEEHGLTEEHLAFEVKENDPEDDNENDPEEGTPVFIKSNRGTTLLQYNGHRYRKAYVNKNGSRWSCSISKKCSAFVYLNDDDEIIMCSQEHIHSKPVQETVDANQLDSALVITSRKGKEMLLFRNYTYRKQYVKGDRCRWVCSTLKNCRAVVFTDCNHDITSVFEEHCHDPPKYYLKPNNVLEALRQPVIIETD
ncbi:hypothetical protein O0L34_g17062 [Tuta absoluta]|nr:hypothetical protein O0L34_g17062 [Tuta absoluta]